MPVSHLALNVSNISEAASFYLSALQPLGYRYIGEQGNSIGLGEKDADFFLCQQRYGNPSPTHIAFSAESTSQVRQCYAAALNAGGFPSGAPGSRNDNCGCFNAAVEDLDGNTIEFILRQPCEAEHQEALPAPSEHSRVTKWQEDVARSGADDTQSMTSFASRTKSRAQTALDLASTTSKSMTKPTGSVSNVSHTKTGPANQGQDYASKAFVGTLLGAAAGAAFAYAMTQSERDSAKDEANFAASMRSRPLQRTMSARDTRSTRSHSNYEGKSTVSKKGHRNFSTTESMHSSRYPPRSMPRNMQRMIEPVSYSNEDSDFQDAISRYTQSRRPAPPRSMTYDAADYQRSKSHVSARTNGYDLNRAATLPVENPWLLEAPKSHHTSRGGSPDEDKPKRRDSVVSVQSRQPDTRRSSVSQANTTKSSRPDEKYENQSRASTAKPSRTADKYERQSRASTTRDSRREAKYDSESRAIKQSRREDRYETESRASTAKPSRHGSHYDSAANAPLPPSRSNSYYSAADKPPQPGSYISAAQVPAPASRTASRYTDVHEIPGKISDLETVVPEDSISCVGLPAPKKSSKSSSRHGSSSRHSEASTVKPARKGSSRHSAQTVPVRPKEEHYGGRSGKRSLMSYA